MAPAHSQIDHGTPKCAVGSTLTLPFPFKPSLPWLSHPSRSTPFQVQLHPIPRLVLRARLQNA
ncbi:hypothetical protein COCVIDRAFT_105657 [Bipolaris victoriae FI3]|uniref:Uncharacterized protein n=1 Tax=Bipolaris victoriae (strain FI3) TaxID=930091 RepID=W7E2Q0_BIPV3|nr:hypothetical protein COCVIDRAFT_105657 [Bipolaris victoriae FI3]